MLSRLYTVWGIIVYPCIRLYREIQRLVLLFQRVLPVAAKSLHTNYCCTLLLTQVLLHNHLQKAVKRV